MTQADSVLSTPPTNTSVDTTRRHFLTVAAAGAAAIATAAPAAAAQAIPPDGFERVLDHQGRVWFKADGMPDPIYAAIERHKAAGAIWEAAVTMRSRFRDGPKMNAEQRRQCQLLDDAEADAWEPCEQTGFELVTTKPTTHAGMVAAIRYIRIQMRDDGTFMPHGLEFEFNSGSEGDGGETLGWVDAFLDTLTSATAALDKAVQS
jgi:hypothetical protein